MVRRLLRIGTSALFLCALVWLLDAEALATRLAALRPRWALLAVGLSVPQMALMAFRWRLTAGRLGLDLPFGVALREYYLATFLNQVLPGSVMGDASRAWRHTRAGDGAPVGPVLRAVILERASGQAVMAATAALSLASMPLAFAIAPRSLLLLGAGICGATVLFAFLVRRRLPSLGPLASEWEDVHKALLARDVFPLQLATSALVVASLLAMYVVAAKAIGVDTPVMTLLPLVAPVLMSMLIPGTVAGWGIREATAAAVWAAVGLTAVDGVAISAAYGVVVLISTLPGGLVLLISNRDRTAGPHPGARAGSEDAAPRRGSRSAAT